MYSNHVAVADIKWRTALQLHVLCLYVSPYIPRMPKHTESNPLPALMLTLLIFAGFSYKWKASRNGKILYGPELVDRVLQDVVQLGKIVSWDAILQRHHTMALYGSTGEWHS